MSARNSKSRTHKRSGYSKATRILAIFAWPFLYALAELLPVRRTPGRRADYPTAIMIGFGMAARVCGSYLALMDELDDSDGRLWELIRAEAARFGLTDLPEIPPAVHHYEQWRKGWVSEQAWRQLTDAMILTAVWMLQVMGYLRRGLPRDLARIDDRETISGDGFNLHRATEVEVGVDPFTGEIVTRRSKATDPSRARRQRWLTDTSIDGKTGLQGATYTHAGCHTSYGTVEIGVDLTAAAEIDTAMPLLERIIAAAHGGVHGIVWDRALYGWPVRAFLHLAQAALISAPYARSHTPAQAAKIRGKVAAELKRARRQDRPITQQVVDEELRRRTTAEMDARYLHDGEPLPARIPVGLSRRADKGRPEWVASHHDHLTNVEHTVDAQPCRHQVWVDDAAAHDVITGEDGVLYKRAPVIVDSAVPRRLPDGRHTQVDIRAHLSCGQHQVEFTVAHVVDADRQAKLSEQQPALWRWNLAHPVNQADGRNRYTTPRNITEGGHQRTKKTFQASSTATAYRATSEIVEHQRLDVAFALMLSSALTWHTYTQTNPDAGERAAAAIKENLERRKAVRRAA